MPSLPLVYVGTYSEAILFGTGQVLQGQGQGIHIFRYSAKDARLMPCGVAAGVRNPSYLAFDSAARFLFCVNEFKEYDGQASGAVSSYRIDRESGALDFISMRASRGTDPCHLTVDATGRFVLVANFASGSVAVLPVAENGGLGDAVTFIQHQGSSIDPKRQAGPHAHAVTLDAANRYAFVPDLGLDQIVIYAFDEATGALKLNSHQPMHAVAPGAGPRQLVFSPGGRHAYLINELNSTMTAYAYESGTGRLSELQTLPTLPDGFAGHSTCAEVQISPDGRFLYGSNRGHNSIAVFRIDPVTGRMAIVGHVPSGGRIPRNFVVGDGGRVLVSANQDTNDLFVFRIDSTTGLPVRTGSAIDVGTPVCVKFLPL
jgi:6-phosphogluconolactonase